MPSSHIESLSVLVGAANCLVEEESTHPFTTDYRGVFHGKALAVVRPADTAEVSRVVAYCHAHAIPVVPQGGNTSLLGGSVPDGAGKSIVLSLSRMNRIRSVDAVNDTMVVEAGVTLHQARMKAEEVRKLFPLRIGSEGSCQIGGNISTNAGGTAVLRYGNMRDLVLGIEAVLPDGNVWHGLRALRKDNTGYDLKQLFIGAEGTLGIVTAAVLKLMPQPRSVCTAFLAFDTTEIALGFFMELRKCIGQDVTAYELISQPALDLVLNHLPDSRAPLSVSAEWYVLVEMASGRSQEELESDFYGAVQVGLENGSVRDAAVAATQAHAADFWRIREEISDAQTRAGGSVRCDISVPLSKMPEFIAQASAGVLALEPHTRMVVYGHVGDGNVHFNPLRPACETAARYLARASRPITHIVDEIAMAMNGSISAEHGVGAAKRDELLSVKSRVELEMAWRIKRAFDPGNLFNPGKFLPRLDAMKEAAP
ncbi:MULTISPECIES: FAD-binding oxidoreductase [Variovorax]|jgi:FAD/FMN-containing dehydrogenase|nr:MULTISPECIES: FAD-binding oxidoreductase [Variovorax]MBN8754740.1 FAD-binding oxidoreductase [Variovorax sp.]ODU19451.1 MAG: hydroxyacid dehydrogenase [Variovorax sp. SCN 67-85]ODV25352.1 MAG: hydroxyacid dehydrogenase [Variovorax sp. SCN 67-20]OJZ03170.1 MAG: hydroxyacid dehydrogenase [Variovorax sp. 67-131]UKI08259.1 FAD-binding oxidoreductase [Variovorax paradoxus]